MISMWRLDSRTNSLSKLQLSSAVQNEEINGENTLDITTLDRVNKYDSVIFKDQAGKWQEFVVQEITEDRDVSELHLEHVSYELHNSIVRKKTYTDSTLKTIFDDLLYGTRWTFGSYDVGGVWSISFEYVNVYEAIKEVIAMTNAEIEFSVNVGVNTVTNRTVNIWQRIGSDKGRIFSYAKDMLGVTKSITNEVITAIIALGTGLPDDEEGNPQGRLNLKALDMPDSPLNKDYVENVTAKNLYGIRNGATKLHRTIIMEFNDIEDANELYLATKAQLDILSQPKFVYEVSVALLTELKYQVLLGDTVHVYDKDFGGDQLSLHGRIVKIKRDLLYPEASQLTIGNVTDDLASHQKKVDQLLAEFKSKTSTWDKTSALLGPNLIPASYIKNLLQEWNDLANASGGYTYTIDGGGSITYDRAIDDNPTKALQIVGGVMRIANSKDPQGNWVWRTALTGDGIIGDQIAAHSITANQLRSDVGANLDLSSNQSINLAVTNVIDDLDFQDGASAYEIAVANGFTGTQADWLASLKGQDGTSVTIKGTKENTNQLPTSNNIAGDGYVIEGDLWVWTGTQWTNVGRIQGQNGKDGIGYQLILTGDDGLVFDSTTETVSSNLRAKVYINNTDVTETLPNTYFTWTRKSNYPNIDNEFNAQGIQNKVLTLTSYYLQTSATYICTLTIPNINGYLLDNNDNALIDANGNKIVVTSNLLTFQQQITIVKDVVPQITTLRSDITQLAGQIELKVNQTTVDQLTNRVATNESNITLTQDEISSKVSQTDFTGAKLVSMINQTPSSVQIMAKNIALEGLTTVNNSFQIDLDGSFSATAGTVGGWQIYPGFIRSVSGANNISIINHNDSSSYFLYTTNNSGNSQFSVSKLGVLKASGAEISGKLTATSGTFTGRIEASSGYINNLSCTNLTINGSNFSGTGYLSSGTLAGTSFYKNSAGWLIFANRISTPTINASVVGGNGHFNDLSYEGTFTKVSDIRKKENFVDIHDEFNNFIYSLPIGTYNYKGSDIPNMGVNANFVDKMLPREFTKYFIHKDEVTGMYSADYTGLIPMLVKVVQSQNSRLIDLEWKIKELERKLQ